MNFFFWGGKKSSFIFALSEHCAVDRFRVVNIYRFSCTVLPDETLPDWTPVWSDMRLGFPFRYFMGKLHGFTPSSQESTPSKVVPRLYNPGVTTIVVPSDMEDFQA